MLKSVLKNSYLYRNTNNVGFIYEFLGNNAFSDDELFELADFLQQNDLMCEFHIINHQGIKTYYVSFYLGEVGWSNNYNTLNQKLFFERYNTILNLRTRIRDLKIFSGDKIREVDLKLYNLDKEQDSDYRKNMLKRLKYNKEIVRNHILQKSFSSYMRNMLEGVDYAKYILQQDYHNNVNYEFSSVDQEIFDVSLKFMTGNKYFIFPFYLKGIKQQTGDHEFQVVNINKMTSFFDDYLDTPSNKGKGQPLLSYQYKVSLKPTRVVADAKNNKVSIDGNSSTFDVYSIQDPRNMFFEFQHSVFLYTKRPDIGKVLADFDVKNGNVVELINSDIPKDFNPQYLSHNRFSDAYHIGHIRNLQTLVGLLKEYYPEKDDGMYIGKEYFSNNKFKVNFFDMAGKDADGNLEANANTMVIGTTGAGKTYLAENRLFKNNNKDQVIVFDNLNNFSKSYYALSEEEKKVSEIGVLEYGADFPNMVGKITRENITDKQNVLLQILLGYKSDLTSENKEMIRAQVFNYIKKNVGGYFKITLFKEYIKNQKVTNYLSASDKALIVNKIEGLDNTIFSILNNDSDFTTEISKYQKVILSYSDLLDKSDKDTAYFLLSVIVRVVRGYLGEKKATPIDKLDFPYTMILFDEAHQVMGKSNELDLIITGFIREIRNLRANIVLITQGYDDVNKKLRRMMNFFILLDKANWDEFVKDKTNLQLAGSEDRKSDKLEVILDNFKQPVQALLEKVNSDEAKKNEGIITGAEATRFCMFAFMLGNRVYMLNTKS